jgi:hypothetical protein
VGGLFGLNDLGGGLARHELGTAAFGQIAGVPPPFPPPRAGEG